MTDAAHAIVEAASLEYGFAKARGVVILSDGPPWRVGMRAGVDALALVEVRRALGALSRSSNSSLPHSKRPCRNATR